ncbi:MAG: DUF6286 domain-containing protein [Actinomycetota bacterium]
MRWLNRVLAAIFGLALAAVGLLVVWEAAATLLGSSPGRMPYESWMVSQEAYRWNSQEVLWVAAGLTALGLVLAALQVVPRKPPALGVALGDAGLEVDVDRSGLEGALTRAATGVSGVTGARIQARRRKVSTTVDVPGGGDKATSEAVTGALQRALELFRVKPSPRVAVSSRARGRAR